jgi:hypothetical protein
MITFLPYLRSGNARAAALHAQYGSDHRRFLAEAREFLLTVDDEEEEEEEEEEATGSSNADGAVAPAQAFPPSASASASVPAAPTDPSRQLHMQQQQQLSPRQPPLPPNMPGNALGPLGGGGVGTSSLGGPVLAGPIGGGGSAAIGGDALAGTFGGLSLGSGGGIPIGGGGLGLGGGSLGGGPAPGLGLGAAAPGGGLGVSGLTLNPPQPLGGGSAASMLPPQSQLQLQQPPPGGPGPGATGRLSELGPAFASPPPPARPVPSADPPGLDLQQQPSQSSRRMPGLPSSPMAATPYNTAPPPAEEPQRPPQSIPATPEAANHPGGQDSVPVTPAQTGGEGGGTAAAAEAKAKEDAPPATTPAKPVWQPRRTHTRLETQAGIVSCNGVQVSPSDPHRQLVIGPRSQLKATWSLPLSYLRERTVRRLQEEGLSPDQANALTIRDALAGLTVGLFRRGCAENGEHHSIVSKEIVPMPDGGNDDGGGDNSSRNQGPRDGYEFEVRHDLSPPSVVGTVPFYTPRTPGNVVLRLYYMNDAVVTLATGPLVRVETTNARELDSTLRFILSNFKAKAGTANFTCLHNFATVLEQFRPDGPARGGGYGGRGARDVYDGAGRAAFGCLAESRKVVDSAFDDYTKKKAKLANQEDELQHIIDALPAPDEADRADEEDDTAPPTELELKQEEMNEVKKGQASNEKKWREMQAAYYSILKVSKEGSNYFCVSFLHEAEMNGLAISHRIAIVLLILSSTGCASQYQLKSHPSAGGHGTSFVGARPFLPPLRIIRAKPLWWQVGNRKLPTEHHATPL